MMTQPMSGVRTSVDERAELASLIFGATTEGHRAFGGVAFLQCNGRANKRELSAQGIEIPPNGEQFALNWSDGFHLMDDSGQFASASELAHIRERVETPLCSLHIGPRMLRYCVGSGSSIRSDNWRRGKSHVRGSSISQLGLRMRTSPPAQSPRGGTAYSSKSYPAATKYRPRPPNSILARTAV